MTSKGKETITQSAQREIETFEMNKAHWITLI